jgi:hypothetical protein
MRFVALLGSLALALAGCQTASNRVPLEQVADVRVGEISVVLADGAQIPAELRDVVAPKVKAAMERHLSPRLKGPTAVRVEVKVRSITIASEAETILIGGVHAMEADVTFIDPRTKAVLFANNSFRNQVGGGGGVGGLVIDRAVLSAPIERVTDGFAFQYAELLRPSEPRS